jgi:hypothetical protein
MIKRYSICYLESMLIANKIPTILIFILAMICSKSFANEEILALSVNDISICEGQTGTLTASGCGGSILWSNGATTSSITVSQAGTYSATCTTGSSVETATGTVTVNYTPTAIASNTSPVCTFGTYRLQYSGISTGSDTYLWTGPNGFSADTRNVTMLLAQASQTGVYTVTVSNQYGCGASATTSVTVHPIPNKPAVDFFEYCQYATPTPLTATPLPNHTIIWYSSLTGGTGSTTAPIPNTNVLTTYIYYASQLNNLTGCESQREEVAVFILPAPDPPVVSSFTYCQGALASPLSASVPSGQSVLWYGTNSTGGTSSSIPPTPSTALAGLTKYYVSAKDDILGCESTRAVINVRVNKVNCTPIRIVKTKGF